MIGKLSFAFSYHFPTMPSSVKYHNHPVYECVYYLSGTGRIHTHKEQYVYSPGSFVILRPNIPHSEVHYTPTISICLGYDALDDDAEFQDEITAISAVTNLNILSSIKMIMNEYEKKQRYYQDYCNALLTQVLVSARRIHMGSASAVTPAAETAQIHDIVWDNSSDADITEIWNAYMNEYKGYSYDRFRHRFKEDMGMSPNQFLIHLRMQKACWLLDMTTLNVTDIALACGFSSCSYFTQQFKKSTGMAPSRYRARSHSSPDIITHWNDKPDEHTKSNND